MTDSDSPSSQDPSPDELAQDVPLLRNSLCLRCKDHRTIVSGRGSVFLLCQSQRVPASWPKYPRQPLMQCPYMNDQPNTDHTD